MRQVHPEERERGVGERIDQVATQRAAAGDELEVLAAKRHDANATGVGAGHLRDAVGMHPAQLTNMPAWTTPAGPCTSITPLRSLMD